MLLLPLLLLPRAEAGEFVDTWVTTAYEDTNVRTDGADFSPKPNFVQRGNRTFFEDYESRYSDDITQTRLALYRADEGFFEGWSTEAALVLRFQPFLDPDHTEPGVELEDDGSYVRIVRSLPGEDHEISLTGYAVDASRFRLGYSYDLSYGGREILARDVGAMPGVRLQWQRHGSYAFLGAKTAISESFQGDWEEGDRNDTYTSLLAGAGVQFGDRLKLEAGAGSFQQGQIENVPDLSSPLYGEMIVALGLSGQVAFRTTDQLDFIQSADLRLIRNRPEQVRDTYISHVRIDGFGALVQAEVNRLVHNLLDSSTNGSQTVLESALSWDVQTLLVHETTTLALDFVYKDLPYILFNVPGLTSGWSLPADMEVQPQLYGRVRLTHYLPGAHLAFSAGAGLMQPAAYQTSDGWYVVYTERDKEATPTGQSPKNILGAIASVQYDVSKSVQTVGELLYTLDNNLSRSEEGEDGRIRVLEDPEVRSAIGFNLMMRARF